MNETLQQKGKSYAKKEVVKESTKKTIYFDSNSNVCRKWIFDSFFQLLNQSSHQWIVIVANPTISSSNQGIWKDFKLQKQFKNKEYDVVLKDPELCLNPLNTYTEQWRLHYQYISFLIQIQELAH
jgi:hypothetical protein